MTDDRLPARIRVTQAEVNAAKLRINLDEELGQPVDPAFKAIAEAGRVTCPRSTC